jgi:AcrR family transcriptional regulator
MQVNKQTARSEATRTKLVDAGRRLFAARGYAGVGTEEIVREAGLTRGALYHQFRDKKDLFEAVVTGVEEEVTHRIAQDVIAKATTPTEALREGAAAFLAICSEPEIERLLLLDAPGVLGWERWREIGQQHGLGVITASLQAAIDAGEIPQQPVRPLAHIVLGALDEAALYVARAPDQPAARAETLAALDRLLFGG